MALLLASATADAMQSRLPRLSVAAGVAGFRRISRPMGIVLCCFRDLHVSDSVP